MKVMYLDESGDHSLDKIDASYPVFVLGGVILERSYARTVVGPRLRQLKEEFFGGPDVIFHTADIIRAKNGFEVLKNADVRARFYQSLNTLMRELEYMVVACVINKDAHLAAYGKNAVDPYHDSLGILVEQFTLEIGEGSDAGFICAEKRGLELDRAIDEAWARIIREGTMSTSGEHIDERIVDLGLKDKHLNIAGLQLADLVVSPIGRAVIGRPTRQDWEIVKSKFRRIGDQYLGCGLVIRP